MNDTGGLLNAKELYEALGISRSTFFLLKAKGFAKQFEVKRPMGSRRYSRLLVERYLAGESTAAFGAGSRRTA